MDFVYIISLFCLFCFFTLVAKFVEAEKNANISPERIVIGGFSQGGSAAYYYGMTNSEPRLGGLIALSCWLPLHEKFLSRTTVRINIFVLPVLSIRNIRMHRCQNDQRIYPPLQRSRARHSLVHIQWKE